MSGSPIRFTDDGKIWNAISILACDELISQNTYGCLLTKKKIDTINKWKEILPKAPNSKEFYAIWKTIPFLEGLGLDAGSPCFFESEDDNCTVS